jgi:hypothetical protein
MLATDSLSLLFIGCFLFGLFFFIAAALLGQFHHGGVGHIASHGGVQHVHVGGAGVHHGAHAASSGHHSSSQVAKSQQADTSFAALLNPTSIIVFLMGFGFFGYVFHNTTRLALPISLLLALLGGLIVAGFLLWLLGKVFGNSEGATIQDVSDRTGLLGRVSLTVPESGLGEVLYVSPGGMHKSIPARSIDGRRLERDQEVVVVNYHHGVAEVDTWDHFVNQEEIGISQTASSTDDLATLRALLENSDLENSDQSDTEYALRKDVSKE